MMDNKKKCSFCDEWLPTEKVETITYLGITYSECADCQKCYKESPDKIWDDLADWAVENV